MENKKSCHHKPDGEKSYDIAGKLYVFCYECADMVRIEDEQPEI